MLSDDPHAWKEKTEQELRDECANLFGHLWKVCANPIKDALVAARLTIQQREKEAQEDAVTIARLREMERHASK